MVYMDVLNRMPFQSGGIASAPHCMHERLQPPRRTLVAAKEYSSDEVGNPSPALDTQPQGAQQGRAAHRPQHYVTLARSVVSSVRSCNASRDDPNSAAPQLLDLSRHVGL